jgi:hypothetical protein
MKPGRETGAATLKIMLKVFQAICNLSFRLLWKRPGRSLAHHDPPHDGQVNMLGKPPICAKFQHLDEAIYCTTTSRWHYPTLRAAWKKGNSDEAGFAGSQCPFRFPGSICSMKYLHMM